VTKASSGDGAPATAGAPGSLGPITFEPIGVIHTPFLDRLSAPRQTVVAEGTPGTIVLAPGRGFEHALSDIEGWGYLWVVFVFHLNTGWRPKVLPPRSSGKRRGVFSTRSPHRPNPIGLSAVRLEAVEGLVLHVRGVDMVDGSPVLDIKPYVPYADSFPDANTGWLGERPADPDPGYEVLFSDPCREQLAFLLEAHGLDLAPQIAQILSLGPQPHPYRRIKVDGDGLRLALKDWRVRFQIDGRLVRVGSLETGYRPAQLADAPRGEGRDTPPLQVHRAFVARFGRRQG
jgi:tRNA (adenine37-N6)-methyltransferase